MEKKTKIWFNFNKSVKLIWRIKPCFLFIVSFNLIIDSIYPVISLGIMQIILNIVQSGNINIKIVLLYICIYVGLDIVQTIISVICGYYSGKYALYINLYVKERVLIKASKLSIKDYESSETYNIIQRAQNESEGKITSYFILVFSLLGVIISIFSYSFLLLQFKPWIIIIVLIIPIIKYIILKKINKKHFDIIVARTNEERQTWYYSYIITNGLYNKEIKINNLYDFFLNKFINNKKKFIEQDISILKESTKKITSLSIVEQLIDGILFVYIINYGAIGKILIGDIVTYTRAIMQIKSNIQSELNSFAEIEKQSYFLDQLFFLLEKEDAPEAAKNDLVSIKSINIRNLSYKYCTEGQYVLKNINIELKSGKTYAIVGKNGSGKTTLAKIIMGFYDDYEGEIFVNDINLKSISKKTYFNRIGALFQDFGRYEATVRENLAYGNLNLIDDDKELMGIFEMFGLAELINNLPGKLESQLGYWFDDGKQISVGQWQKIALCRAFIKKADAYILDEPNASLDTISEYNLSLLYQKLLKNKLGIIIAHKFGTFISNVQEIIVMDNGEIAEIGTHNELLMKKGIYYKLNSPQ